MNRIVFFSLLLASLLTGAALRDRDFSSVFWDAVGCEADPNGYPKSQPTADAGCEMDPNGRPSCHPGS